MKMSSVNGKPHEIRGKIDTNGSISSFIRTCPAGMSNKCKHILEILFFVIGEKKFINLNFDFDVSLKINSLNNFIVELTQTK